FGGQDVPYRTLERKPAIGRPAVGCHAAAFGPKIQQPPVRVAQLREQKTPSIADFGVINPELVAMISQRQRGLQIVRHWAESAEMVDPLIVAKPAEPNRGRPPVVAVAERMLREGGGFDHVPEPVGDGFDLGVGAILRRLRIGWHLALVGSPGDKRKAGKGWDRQPAMGSPHYEDRTWTSPDGLTLHYRDYAGPAGKPPILCIPGLTRNARDFEPVVDSLAGEWRIICAELRGRGESEYARDSSTYAIPNYVADIETLLKQAQIARFVACGTSLGGIITLLLALRDPHRIAGAILNDIGTVVEPAGLARIAEYVGQGRS